MMDPKVIKVMEFLKEMYGDSRSEHLYGRAVEPALKVAQEQLYTGLNAQDADDVVVTSGAVESQNWVLKSVYENYIKEGEKDHIITSEVESAAVLETCQYLESLGVRVTYLPVNNEGMLQVHLLSEVMSEKTALVSISWVNPYSGMINNVKAVADMCMKQNVLCHIDASHAIGRVRVDAQMIPADFISFGAELFHGPRGVGGLFIKAGTKMTPLFHGGTHMGGLRAGSLNTAGIVGLGEAIKIANLSLLFDDDDIIELRDMLEEAVLALGDVKLLGGIVNRVAGTLLVSIKGVESEALLWDLDQAGIGAYMLKGDNLGIHPFVSAIGLEESYARSVIGFSLSRHTEEEEITHTIGVMKKSVERLRALSCTYGKGN